MNRGKKVRVEVRRTGTGANEVTVDNGTLQHVYALTDSQTLVTSLRAQAELARMAGMHEMHAMLEAAADERGTPDSALASMTAARDEWHRAAVSAGAERDRWIKAHDDSHARAAQLSAMLRDVSAYLDELDEPNEPNDGTRLNVAIMALIGEPA